MSKNTYIGTFVKPYSTGKNQSTTWKFKTSKQKVDGNELRAVSGKEKTVADTQELFESLVVTKVGKKGDGRKKIWVGKLSFSLLQSLFHFFCLRKWLICFL